MNNFKYVVSFFSILVLTIFINYPVYANMIYKHTLPLTVKIEKRDTLTVNYDFSARNGIHCRAVGATYQMSVMYKGHQKLITLPVTLQSHHVPAQYHEVLADTVGKFMIEMILPDQEAVGEVFCDYV